MTIGPLNIDTILSEPLLLVSAVLLVISPVIFLISLWKFVVTPKSADLPVFDHETTEPATEGAPAPEPEPAAVPEPSRADITEAEASVPRRSNTPERLDPPPAPPVEAPAPSHAAMDKTIVIPAGIAELQGQLEIAFSQIKMLNKKIHSLESEMESVARQAVSRLDTNELKEPPMNPADFTQKLLKIAEHVIILEKEMARLRTAGKIPEAESAHMAQPAAPAAPKPPIMPI